MGMKEVAAAAGAQAGRVDRLGGDSGAQEIGPASGRKIDAVREDDGGGPEALEAALEDRRADLVALRAYRGPDPDDEIAGRGAERAERGHQTVRDAGQRSAPPRVREADDPALRVRREDRDAVGDADLEGDAA